MFSWKCWRKWYTKKNDDITISQLPLGHDKAWPEKTLLYLVCVRLLNNQTLVPKYIISNLWLNMNTMESNNTFKVLIFVIPGWHFSKYVQWFFKRKIHWIYFLWFFTWTFCSLLLSHLLSIERIHLVTQSICAFRLFIWEYGDSVILNNMDW